MTKKESVNEYGLTQAEMKEIFETIAAVKAHILQVSGSNLIGAAINDKEVVKTKKVMQ